MWKPRSLWLGFGQKLFHQNAKLIDPYYGEWEIGTYYCAWRVTKGGQILCGSTDAVDSIEELDFAIKKIAFGRILSLVQSSTFDIRAEFDTGVAIDFLATISDEAECFGILHGPGNLAVEFTIAQGWASGPLDLPWQQQNESA